MRPKRTRKSPTATQVLTQSESDRAARAWLTARVRQCPKCGAEYADSILFCPNDGTATRLRDGDAGGAARDSFIGMVVDGRYRIDSRIGEGGMGVVYRATHLVLKKLFAIKVM